MKPINCGEGGKFQHRLHTTKRTPKSKSSITLQKRKQVGTLVSPVHLEGRDTKRIHSEGQVQKGCKKHKGGLIGVGAGKVFQGKHSTRKPTAWSEKREEKFFFNGSGPIEKRRIRPKGSATS